MPSCMQIGLFLPILLIRINRAVIPHFFIKLSFRHVCDNSGLSIPENLILILSIFIVSPSIISRFVALTMLKIKKKKYHPM